MKVLSFTTATLSAGLLAMSAPMSADAEVLVAGWDAFTAAAEETSSPTILDADTTANMSGTAAPSAIDGDPGSWSDWNNNGFGASTDGTFGNLSTSVAMASTAAGSGSGGGDAVNLSLSRQFKPGTLTFSLTNNSGADRLFQGFYFDGAARQNQSAFRWDLEFSDAIAGTVVEGELANRDGSGMMDISAAQRDQFADLTLLADNLWEAGSTATFTLTFGGGASVLAEGGGHETLIDNIGITVVPEPSSLALLGLGGLLIARRRRGK